MLEGSRSDSGLALLALGEAADLGPVAARRSWARGFALLGVSTPAFLIGTAAQYGFWYKLHLAPGTGYV